MITDLNLNFTKVDFEKIFLKAIFYKNLYTNKRKINVRYYLFNHFDVLVFNIPEIYSIFTIFLDNFTFIRIVFILNEYF